MAQAPPALSTTKVEQKPGTSQVKYGSYPPSMGGGMPFVTFSAYKYQMPKAKVEEAEQVREALSSITLYVPGGVQEKVGGQWGTEEIIPLFYGGRQFVLSDVVDSALKATGKAVKATASSYTGLAAAPNEILVFQKTSFYDMSFSYNFMPIDEKEAAAMLAAIKLFKESTLPTLKVDSAIAYLEYPPVWDIKFNLKGTGSMTSGDGAYMNMALVDFSATYSDGSTSVLIYEDGTPVQVTMSLTFKSIETAFKRG